MKRIKTEMHFKLSNLNSNLALTLGYLNPALNNSAQDYIHLDDHIQPTNETSLYAVGSKQQTTTSEYVTSLPMNSGVEKFNAQI